jgi:hypothetical protein
MATPYCLAMAAVRDAVEQIAADFSGAFVVTDAARASYARLG